jgi:hypothetical protein
MDGPVGDGDGDGDRDGDGHGDGDDDGKDRGDGDGDDDNAGDGDGDGDGDSNGDGDGDGGGDGDGDGDGDTDHPSGTVCKTGLGEWHADDVFPPSQDPPCSFKPEEVPQFVGLGFDDNGTSGNPLVMGGWNGGMHWALEMIKKFKNADGSPAKLSFFHTSAYADQPMGDQPTLIKDAWHTAYMDGHEAGNHTQTHNTTVTTSLKEWESEIDTCLSWLTKPFDAADLAQYAMPVAEHGAGIKLEDIFGFRTPKLEYNDDTFKVVNARENFWYDCSIDEGGEDDQDGTNYFWPYTLENGSPGHDAFHDEPLSSHPGLWELPVYEVIVPPDELCEQYGVEPGLRDKLMSRGLSENGKVTGFDYNLWYGLQLTKAEFLATLKYTLDLRLQGNRAPFLLGVHSMEYSNGWNTAPQGAPNERDRQEAIEEFLQYAVSKKSVRVVSHKQVLDWIRNPVSL